MSYKQPDICIIDSPVGIEVPIQAIQLQLQSLDWLQKSFGRAITFNETYDNKTVKKPKILQSDGDYYNVLPNDNFVSQSFISVISNETSLSIFKGNSKMKTRDLRITFSGNIKEIGKTTEQLKIEIENELSKVYEVKKINSFVDEKAETVFDGYTIDDKNTQYSMFPFFCFRFDITVIYSDSLC